MFWRLFHDCFGFAVKGSSISGKISRHCLQPKEIIKKSNPIISPFSRAFQRHFLNGSFEFLRVMWLAEMPTILLGTDKTMLVIFRILINIRRRQEQKRPEKSTEEGQAENTICWPPAYSHVNTGLIQFFSRCLFDTVHSLYKRPLTLCTVRQTLVLRPTYSADPSGVGVRESRLYSLIYFSRTVFSCLALLLWEIPLEQWVG